MKTNSNQAYESVLNMSFKLCFLYYHLYSIIHLVEPFSWQAKVFSVEELLIWVRLRMLVHSSVSLHTDLMQLRRKYLRYKSGKLVYDVCDPMSSRTRRAYCFFQSGLILDFQMTLEDQPFTTSIERLVYSFQQGSSISYCDDCKVFIEQFSSWDFLN